MLTVNAVIELGNRNQGSSMGAILSNEVSSFYENNKNPKRFQIMNRLGSGPDGKYYVDFLGDTQDKNELKKSVEEFLLMIQSSFADPNEVEVFVDVLQMEVDDYIFPEFKNFTIL
jgi:hypothetical protein